MSILGVAALLLAAGVLGLALRIDVARRRAPALPPPDPAPSATTALLPVRDEEENVAPCLAALLASTALPDILVIDDASTDRTAERVAAIAAHQPRVRLLAAGALPAGWRGKVNALRTGAAEAITPWLLCLDADSRHPPDLLARAHAAARDFRLDAISLAGRQRADGLGENLLIPVVFALLDLLLGDWRAAADGTGAAVATGQFLLVRRAAFEAAGGFAAIRNETLDDVALVQLLRRSGFRTGFLRAPELQIRMYEGTRAAFLGWRRNLGGFLGTRTGLVAATLALLVVPAVTLGGALAWGHWPEAAILWAAGVGSSLLVRRGGDSTLAYAFLYPFDALFLALTLALGVRDRRRGTLTSWKGRTIEVEKG